MTVTFAEGSLAVVDPRFFRTDLEHLVSTFLDRVRQAGGIASTACDFTTGACRIDWADASTPPTAAAQQFVVAMREALAGGTNASRGGIASWFCRRRRRRAATMERSVTPPPTKERVALVKGPKRVLYAAAGGASAVMTIVGLIVPGIPTVPFLLTSSYFLARSSRRAHAALLATPMFGDIVREWDAHEAISRASKRKLVIFTLIIIAITVSFAPWEPGVLAFLAVIATLCIASIARLPEIPDGDEGPSSCGPSDRTPLSSHEHPLLARVPVNVLG